MLMNILSSFQGHAPSWQSPSQQSGERSRQREQEIQAHCRGSAEEGDQIVRKFNVQGVRGRCLMQWDH